MVHLLGIYTFKRNKTLHFFYMEIHGVVFKALDRHNEPSSFQEMLRNSTTHCLK